MLLLIGLRRGESKWFNMESYVVFSYLAVRFLIIFFVSCLLTCFWRAPLSQSIQGRNSESIVFFVYKDMFAGFKPN